MIAADEAERFWAKVRRGDGCWEWAGRSRHRFGYGMHWVRGRGGVGTHRLAWEITHGERPDGYVCHACDNPPCVRPEHLFLGTRQDNFRDMRAKRRHTHGEGHRATRLANTDVLEIRRRYREGEATQVQLAAHFGVVQTIISRIVRGQTWKHLGEADPSDHKRTNGRWTRLLSDTQELAIVAASDRGVRQKDIAADFGVDFRLVSRVLKRRRREAA